jgi:purine-binding chemotaxis protein CheW
MHKNQFEKCKKELPGQIQGTQKRSGLLPQPQLNPVANAVHNSARKSINEMNLSTPTNEIAEAGKFLHFLLGQERYSLPVVAVREIIRVCPITPVPRMPPYHLGVINLRGKIVPVMDLRRRLHLEPAESLDRACIIVVLKKSSDNQDQLIGIQVDVVDEVSYISQDSIEPPPDFCDVIDGKFIMAMAKNKDHVITILNVKELLEREEIQISSRAIHLGKEEQPT